MLPIGHYRASVKGREFRAVVCEDCRVEFVYLLSCQAEGRAMGVMLVDADAAARALRQANAELRRALAREQDPVPCPSCGWYQRSMVPLVRREHRAWMFLAGAFLLSTSLLLIGGGALGWALTKDRAEARGWASFVEAGAWGAAIGGGLVLARRLLAALVRPNDEDVDKRKELGRRLARTRAEFDRLVTAGAESAEPARAPDCGGGDVVA